MPYKHEYDHIIVSGLIKGKLNFSQIYQLLLNKSYPGISETTVSRHLTKLVDDGMVQKDKQPNRSHNEVYYSLSLATKLELEFFDSFEPIKSYREPRSYVEMKEADRKACLLTLLLAASGTEFIKVVNEPVVGAAVRYNRVTGRYETLVGQMVDGVTHQDIVEHNDMRSLFRHVDFTKSKNYVKILKNDFNFRDVLEEVHRDGGNGNMVIKITDERLRMFLTFCEVMLSDVDFRMAETLKIGIVRALYKKGSLSLTELTVSDLARSFSVLEQETFKWYIDMCGRDEFNRLYNQCKMWSVNNQIKGGIRAKKREIRKFIQNTAHQIERWDKDIIARYHGHIKCDKIVDFPRGVHIYKEYRDYVRNIMSEKYRLLMNCLLKMVYPEFLRKHHGDDPKLKQFIESLPNLDASNRHTWLMSI